LYSTGLISLKILETLRVVEDIEELEDDYK
jgi:hypothetical protein